MNRFFKHLHEKCRLWTGARKTAASSGAAAGVTLPETAGNPYDDRPDYSFWRRAVARTPWMAVDLLVEDRAIVNRETKIASAGSCFAQHIARTLRQAGYQYFSVEDDGNPSPVFSANYGNIYTARQLLQLFTRAFGEFALETSTSLWPRAEDGLWLDAFRPTACRAAASREDAERMRRGHLARVRRLFEEMEVFVFTLGLTECWVGKADGAVFPVAPGVLSRNFSDRFEFKNLTCAEVVGDLRLFLRKVREVNPKAQAILTVSPVPLMASYEKTHVLVANTYSKSVLRVAAHEVCATEKNVVYFPSYEVFTGQHTLGRFYKEDLREVRPDGVAFAMSLFMKHFTDQASRPSGNTARPQYDRAELEDRVLCDEELLDR